MPDIDAITLLREWTEAGTPGCPVVILSGHGTVETAVEATRLGAVDFVEKPLSLAKLLRTVRKALDTSTRTQQTGPRRGLRPVSPAPTGRSEAMRLLRDRAAAVAARQEAVLIVGEPGSGRSVLARYIHGLSVGPDSAFVTLHRSFLESTAQGTVRPGSLSGPPAALSICAISMNCARQRNDYWPEHSNRAVSYASDMLKP